MFIKSSAFRQAGISLIELVMFIVIVSFGVLGVLSVLSQATKRSGDPQIRKQALSIAEGLMEEVTLAHFTYCDPTDSQAASATDVTGCTNASYVENFGQEAVANAVGRPYDNVNDYVPSSGAAVTYNTDVTGATFPTGYTAKVTITPDPGLGPTGQQINSSSAAATMNVLRVTVTVTYGPTSESVTLDGYRTRYAPTYLP